MGGAGALPVLAKTVGAVVALGVAPGCGRPNRPQFLVGQDNGLKIRSRPPQSLPTSNELLTHDTRVGL